MAYTTQYIGSRYVPIFAEPAEWDSTRTYEPLTIVMHDGNSYTSRQYVPIGIEITNDKFWALTGNYNAQVDAYRHEVDAYRHEVDGAIDTMTDKITQYKSDIDASEQNFYNQLNTEFGAVIPLDSAPIENSTKGVTSGGVYNTIAKLQNNLDLKLDIYVTPEMYGAVGDGITDDSSAFEQAIQSGLPIVLKNKTYLVANTLKVNRQAVTFLGTTYYPGTLTNTVQNIPDNSTILYTGETYLFDVELDTIDTPYNSRVAGFRLQNLTIKGNNSNTLVYGVNASEMFISNCTFANAKYGFNLIDSWDSIFFNCKFINGAEGIHSEGSADTTNALHVVSCRFEGLSSYGVCLKKCVDNLIVNCKFEIYNDDYCVAFYTKDSINYNNSIMNCFFTTKSGTYAIKDNGINNVICGCSFHGNNIGAIDTTGVTIFTNNVIYSDKYDATAYIVNARGFLSNISNNCIYIGNSTNAAINIQGRFMTLCNNVLFSPYNSDTLSTNCYTFTNGEYNIITDSAKCNSINQTNQLITGSINGLTFTNNESQFNKHIKNNTDIGLYYTNSDVTIPNTYKPRTLSMQIYNYSTKSITVTLGTVSHTLEAGSLIKLCYVTLLNRWIVQS